MSKPYLATPARTREIMEKYHFAFKKSLGQNFIVDLNILRNIIHHAGIDQHSGVIEIGPGFGALTEQLAIHAEKVIAFEIDQRLLPILAETLKDYDNIHIIHQDILKADIHQAIETHFRPDQNIHIVANLPYYITTPILMKVLTDRLPIENMTIMIQKEVADRIAAQPNNKHYGSLSIAVQYYTRAEVVMNVPKTVFKPEPNVESSVLKLTMRKEPPVQVVDEDLFFSVVRACFAHRRKTIRNNLTRFDTDPAFKQAIDDIFNQANIAGSRRAESLTMAEFAQLANAIASFRFQD